MASEGFGTMAEDYVKILWKAEEWGDEPPTTNTMAAVLGVAPSSVSGNLRKLMREGLIDYEPYGRATLTDRGRDLASEMVRRHRLIETFLVEHFGYAWDEVHAEAEILEHAVSDRLLDLIDHELGSPNHDPHGDPIPRLGAASARPEGRRLHDIATGDEAIVVRVSDHDPELLRYLDGLSIRVGTRLVVVARHDFAGSLSVEILGHDVEMAFVASNAIWVHTLSGRDGISREG